MYIYGSSQIHTAQPLSAPHRPLAAQAPQSRGVSGVDQLDISPEADLISQVHDLPDVRQDKVNSIRAQIASGTYDTDAKLDAALSRLLDEIG
ncbi:Anti-sigma-28 factor, FlgM [Anatilimnocola aggregata]|uniref:Anti-sigma-28 factor, FlgM n=1 Tax=Anatilimnocola aggregata TaxID=2528021 RepID=A0A517YBP1_9BACT|nr:flagellar biosynthesis anti-sigma factor FlgM [Anatilimnocola aggregata]QDU27673.1 Anti-sigma-28 factor, FlgM [Anatilimnocola aggregata]